MFCLDSSKHYQVIPLHDRIDLCKYDGKMVYGIFNKYSRIDGFSIFEVNEDIIQIDRDLKIEELLK